jgi:hypothetical protein
MRLQEEIKKQKGAVERLERALWPERSKLRELQKKLLVSVSPQHEAMSAMQRRCMEEGLSLSERVKARIEAAREQQERSVAVIANLEEFNKLLDFFSQMLGNTAEFKRFMELLEVLREG